MNEGVGKNHGSGAESWINFQSGGVNNSKSMDAAL